MYNCKECANKGTPLCNECSSITKPSGEETRPTHFVKLISLDKVDKLIVNINAYIERKKPIPTAMVLAYNDLTSED